MQQTSVSRPTRVQVGEKVLRIRERLGNGAFGVVYKVTDEESSRVYALKDVECLNVSEILDAIRNTREVQRWKLFPDGLWQPFHKNFFHLQTDKECVKEPERLRNAIREVQTMKQISHENVISVIGADQFYDGQSLHILILIEYCPGGNLNERLKRTSSEELNLKWICQMAAALSFLHSRRVVHRDLKADNVLLTATEDVKLADFGLAREYIALKRIEIFRDDVSWMACYMQYYMNSGVGPIHWVAPEFFSGRYTEKADVFSLGTLFYAILERDFVMINGKAFYGAYKRIPSGGKVGIGYAMSKYGPNTSIQFSPRAQGSSSLQRIVLDAMKYNKDDRPSAAEIHDRVTSVQRSVRLHNAENQQSPSAAGGCC